MLFFERLSELKFWRESAAGMEQARTKETGFEDGPAGKSWRRDYLHCRWDLWDWMVDIRQHRLTGSSYSCIMENSQNPWWMRNLTKLAESWPLQWTNRGLVTGGERKIPGTSWCITRLKILWRSCNKIQVLSMLECAPDGSDEIESLINVVDDTNPGKCIM